jgi:hypothetical protein
MDANEQACYIEHRAALVARHLRNDDAKALQAACDLRAQLDYVCRELTAAAMREMLTPLDWAKNDLDSILALRAKRQVAHG